MRCLGRLVLLAILLIAGTIAWLYRDELHRWVDHQLHPHAALERVGMASPAALTSATRKLAALQRTRSDSTVLSASELAALLVQGSHDLPGATGDSLTVELEERSIRLRTVVDSGVLPSVVRAIIPGAMGRYQPVTITGTLNPVRAGLAEFEVTHASLRGVPLPSDVVGHLIQGLTGRGTDGRVDVVLPEIVGGFRVHADGVTVYRQGVTR